MKLIYLAAFQWIAFSGIAIGLSPLAMGAEYSPNTNDNFPKNVYWGDTHLHTAYSTDANIWGDSLGPADAYRFARGEPVKADNGMTAQLDTPLDFLVVSDHAEQIADDYYEHYREVEHNRIHHT